MTITITRERPDTPDAIQLIEELEGVLSPLYPDESRHGYSVDKLIQEGVVFFVVRVDGKPAACGGIQLYPEGYSELKRMYVNPDFRGRGLAKKLLNQLTDYSRENDVLTVRLETGIHQHEALSLYEKFGFERIEPFGDYQPDPNSIFMEKTLS